jgi:hypothetical protein
VGEHGAVLGHQALEAAVDGEEGEAGSGSHGEDEAGHPAPPELRESLVLHLERREAEEEVAGGVAEALAGVEGRRDGRCRRDGRQVRHQPADLLFALPSFRRGQGLLEEGPALLPSSST